MKASASQASAAHPAVGRRPDAIHPVQRSSQHAAPRPGPRSTQETGPAGQGGSFIPDLVTHAENMADSLEILVQLAANTLSRATGSRVECGLVLNRNKRGTATAGTGIQPAKLARLEQELGEGPMTEALQGGATVAMNEAGTDVRWGRYRLCLQNAGFNSVLAVRLNVGGGAEAALALFSGGPQAFPLQAITEARNFAEAASRSLNIVLELETAKTRAADLQSALESRTSIDIACGVIMAQNRCSYNDAIAIISKASSHRNIKLRKIAEGILENLPGGAPDTHFEH